MVIFIVSDSFLYQQNAFSVRRCLGGLGSPGWLLSMLVLASQPPHSSVCASAFPAMKISERSRGRSCQRKPVKTWWMCWAISTSNWLMVSTERIHYLVEQIIVKTCHLFDFLVVLPILHVKQSALSPNFLFSGTFQKVLLEFINR